VNSAIPITVAKAMKINIGKYCRNIVWASLANTTYG